MSTKASGRSFFAVLFGLLVFAFLGTELQARRFGAEYPVDPKLYQAMQWRNIGPFRGGRVCAVAGVPEQPLVYYMGATGGGVWKTEDGGLTWKNISDGYFKTVSIGAITVAPSDANVIYVGTGEAPIRGVTTTHGDGVYKSTDAGKTWVHIGLEDSRQISTIRVHPQNPDIVYVAVQGSAWVPSKARGIYRSLDGGKTWQLVLHLSERAGASDLSMDATNPRILYAAFWQHQRKPWQIISGGVESGIYKSIDGGDTWEKLTKGLPRFAGKIGVSVSPANPDRVWALIEAEDGGLFRSDDAGKSWKRINKDRLLRARAWYYTEVFADPQDEETVYVLNAPMLKSVDGGKTFKNIPTPHGDNHDLWINPTNNRIMINGNDGGANVSFNGGKTWSTQANQPTGQFYRVITDKRFPYYVYGGQQDNSAIAIASRTTGNGIGPADWYSVSGCESAYLAFDPDNPVYVYGGCYQGIIEEFNHTTKSDRNIMAYPILGLGSDAKEQKYRFNWNAPIVASPHNPGVIYHAANVLLKTEDRGLTWTPISPDLTRNEIEKQGKGGAPITNEAAGAEVYNTIFYVVESPHAAGTIWVGTDDGLVHLTRDGGTTWQNVTPKNLPEAQINAIEVSPHDPATAYLAVTRYKFDDFTPYIFKTSDYGMSWQQIVNGIDGNSFVRVVREDPRRRGLLYAGTENGLYISFDDGRNWQPFQLNLPIVPITDLTIRNDDLVASTQGRAFWILDDLTPLHQISDAVTKAPAFLFKPRKTYRLGGSPGSIPHVGKNPPPGALIYYAFAEAPDTSREEVVLEIVNAGGDVVRRFSSKPTVEATAGEAPPFGPPPMPKTLPVKAGMNRFVWDLRVEDISRVPKLFTYGSLRGYRVAPGVYRARLLYRGQSLEQEFEVAADPRTGLQPGDFREQQEMLAAIWQQVDELHRSVIQIRQVRQQIRDACDRLRERQGADSVIAAGERLVQAMTAWEEQVVQPKQETFQDVINFPNKLNAQFIYLMNAIDTAGPPLTTGMRQRFADLGDTWTGLKAERARLLAEELAAFNRLYQEGQFPAILVTPRDRAALQQ